MPYYPNSQPYPEMLPLSSRVDEDSQADVASDIGSTSGVLDTEVSPENLSLTTEGKKDLKKLLSDPDGNIYRGWAVGIQKGGRQRLLTVLVIMVQIFGPLFLLWWTRTKFRTCRVRPIWDFIKEKTDDSPALVMLSSLVSDAHPEVSTLVQMKVLGSVLMLLIFFSNDLLLLRMDLQTDKLRRYFYKTLSMGWMWVDAFCNCWAVVLTSFAMVPLFFSVEDMLGLVLDSFGLLFLVSLDDYSGSIEYGIETSDFDKIVEDQRIQVEENHRAGHTHEFYDRGDLELDIDGDGVVDEAYEAEFICNRFRNGDVLFSFARLVGQFWLVIGLFVFMLLHVEMPKDGEASETNDGYTQGLSPGVLQNVGTWLPVSLVMLFFWLIMRSVYFILGKQSGESNSESSGLGDCMAFVYIVILRRPDPRYLVQ